MTLNKETTYWNVENVELTKRYTSKVSLTHFYQQWVWPWRKLYLGFISRWQQRELVFLVTAPFAGILELQKDVQYMQRWSTFLKNNTFFFFFFQWQRFYYLMVILLLDWVRHNDPTFWNYFLKKWYDLKLSWHINKLNQIIPVQNDVSRFLLCFCNYCHLHHFTTDYKTSLQSYTFTFHLAFPKKVHWIGLSRMYPNKVVNKA